MCKNLKNYEPVVVCGGETLKKVFEKNKIKSYSVRFSNKNMISVISSLKKIIRENDIKIVLPIFEKNADLTEDEIVVYKLLSKTMLKPISEVAPYVPFGKSKTTKILKGMCEKGVITVEGKGKGTKYIIS